jgi:DNA-3-methyladenine glycosylase
MTPLPRSFYARPTVTVARELLGKVLVRGERRARIVEVEAYLGERDQASHARRGPTARAGMMFGPAGYLYVYLIYGMHHCMNFVTEEDGVAGAVLIRAASVAGEHPRLYAGPGKLCAGLAVTMLDKGLDLCDRASGLYVIDDGATPRIAASARIGVEYAGAWARRRLRFYVPGHPSVSGRLPVRRLSGRISAPPPRA